MIIQNCPRPLILNGMSQSWQLGVHQATVSRLWKGLCYKRTTADRHRGECPCHYAQVGPAFTCDTFRSPMSTEDTTTVPGTHNGRIYRHRENDLMPYVDVPFNQSDGRYRWRGLNLTTQLPFPRRSLYCGVQYCATLGDDYIITDTRWPFVATARMLVLEISK